MLSRNEQQQLRAIEQWFEISDPELTRSLREGRVRQWNLGRRLLCLVLMVTGVGLIGLGAVAGNVLLLFVGILSLTTGVCLRIGALRP
ncbi:hypothetical protein GCM10027445_31770 [Amycolatopsis endophytica]|uniref:Uncharacterized membrane protein HdeD (DUF308 family) n=1 Tax=Amycolatopsis endophytica TaxID=860233 RepID=A0A853B1Z2_9PSEU|nr:DUF3040 domain-containing protein [Amycolatopsis endophytica]NYI88801.1 uncharacterized membrane protein HdeD (DUF308 family) [Amycolatopsis endophytica]